MFFGVGYVKERWCKGREFWLYVLLAGTFPATVRGAEAGSVPAFRG